MKITTAFLSLSLAALLATGSACSFNTSNVNVPPPNIAANTNANAEPAGTPSSSAAESAMAPEALVAELYKVHDAKRSPFFQTKDRARVDKYFTKTLADLIWKDATSSKGEVGAIDGDPLYNAQDMEIKNFAIGKGVVKGDSATVAVTFTNFGDKKTITYALKQVNAAWKIDDIKYGEGDSLMKWLKDTYPKATQMRNSEFSGKYQVGDTYCTVTPAKMVYEVKWEKGTGTEMFFSKDMTSTFESSPDKGEPNRFAFDDGTFSSGTFYRADGKSFPVKRAK